MIAATMGKRSDAGLVVLAVATLGFAATVVMSGPGTTASPAGPYVPAPLPTVSVSPTAKPASLDVARKVLAQRGPLTVSVLGDSTGNDRGEWVDLWARHLGQDRRVTLHQWDPVASAWLPHPVAYGSKGPSLTIWNASVPGATPANITPLMDRAQPERPGLVVLNFGHNGQPGDQRRLLDGVVAASRDLWESTPLVAMDQNPESGAHAAKAADNMARVRDWAVQNGVPMVEVGDAFTAAGDIAALLRSDGVHPNDAGSRVWADAVAEALD